MALQLCCCKHRMTNPLLIVQSWILIINRVVLTSYRIANNCNIVTRTVQLLLLLAPLVTAGFNIARVIFEEIEYALKVEWEESGSGEVVDNYTISINPRSISHPISNVVLISPSFTILRYNMIYNATIISTNCNGKSKEVTLTNIEYGMLSEVVALVSV